MKDENKTKKQLIDELEELRQKIAVLETSTIEHTPASNGLRESKERYSAIFDQAVDSIVLIDPETATLVEFNERAHKNLGYTREEFKKLKIADFEISETTEEIARHIKKILKAGSDTFETKHRTKDGQIRNINVCTGIIHIRGRKFVQSIFHDITEKKLVEGELVKTKDRLDNIIDSSLDSIAVSDGAGHLIRVNNSFLSLLGYRKEEVLKRHIAELTPMMEGTYESTTGEPVQLDKEYFNNIDTAISTLLKDRKISNWESFWLRKDGKVVPTEQNIVYLYNDGEDAIEAVGIIRDISERKKVEKEIKEARDFLKSVIEGSRDGIVITDAKGHILSINTAMEQMCGFGKEKLIGKHSSTLVIDDKDMRRSIRDKVPELFEKGFTSYEAIHKNKDGKYIDVECNTSMIKDDKGQSIVGVSIVRDITERKQMERQLLQAEKLKSLGELAGGVAHGFNNILAAILGRVQLLMMHIDTPTKKQERRKSVTTLRKGLGIVEKAALDGAETVRRIQEFARSTDRGYFFSLNLNEVIDDALEFTKVRWKGEAESKGIKFTIKQNFSPLPPISGNAPELREFFTNLFSNSIDAMPQGGNITIETSVDNNHVLITIADTGIGIPETIRERVFDPFFTTKGVQSTGLGLSVSYGIINRHKGTIRVESAEGEGTTFTIKFPLSKEKSMPKKVKESPPRKHKEASILVIEDEKDVRELLADLLISKGHKVDTAADGIKGIKLFKKKEFDLVFTDLGMPEMSGWQVAKEIKKINKKTPVVLITGWNVQLKKSELKKSGIDLLANKPFQVDQVLQLVQDGIAIKKSL